MLTPVTGDAERAITVMPAVNSNTGQIDGTTYQVSSAG